MNTAINAASFDSAFDYNPAASRELAAGGARAEQKTLGQDEFFKLLTTQLASQDPLSPMEDTAFIAQMANFSQLEMTSQLTKSFDKFTSSQELVNANGFIGKTVYLSSGEVGNVTSVRRLGDDIQLQVQDFTGNAEASYHDIEKVSRVTEAGQAYHEYQQAMALVGKRVALSNGVEGTVSNVFNENSQFRIQLNNAEDERGEPITYSIDDIVDR